MPRLTLLICGLLFSSLLAASQTSSPLAGFLGEWNGLGKMFERETAVNLSWAPTLDGKFTRISVVYQSRDDNQPFRFEGVGYYRADGTGFSGTWFDSQGNMHPLTARLQDETLTTSWGSASTELGQSVYRLLENGSLEVIDSVQNEAGDWREFARVVLNPE